MLVLFDHLGPEVVILLQGVLVLSERAGELPQTDLLIVAHHFELVKRELLFLERVQNEYRFVCIGVSFDVILAVLHEGSLLDRSEVVVKVAHDISDGDGEVLQLVLSLGHLVLDLLETVIEDGEEELSIVFAIGDVELLEQLHEVGKGNDLVPEFHEVVESNVLDLVLVLVFVLQVLQLGEKVWDVEHLDPVDIPLQSTHEVLDVHGVFLQIGKLVLFVHYN